jgi:periplasmic protein CpxP/Spy
LVLTLQINCIMNKTKVLTIAVIVLVLLNISVVATFMLNKPPHPPGMEGRQSPKTIIIERLHFNETQIAAYDDLIKEHRTTIQNKEEQLKLVKEELYALLAADNQTTSTDLITKINMIQKEIEEIHFNHFLDIKKLCKPEQLSDFNELTNELASLFSPIHEHPPRR